MAGVSFLKCCDPYAEQELAIGSCYPRVMSSLTKRINYLGLADFDYLAARLRLSCGLLTGFAKAAEAFEKILKLFLILEAKISQDEELDPKDLKVYGHSLTKLFGEVKRRVPDVTWDSGWDDYFRSLEESYAKRYPEHWKEFSIEIDIDKLDRVYAYFRGNVSRNSPKEEKDRAQQFGTFIGDAYTQEFLTFIKSRGGLTPMEILRSDNKHLDQMNIAKSKI